MPGIKRNMTVCFDEATRAQLDRFAVDAGIVHPDGTPRDAELVRVLLVSQLFSSSNARARAALALYSNSVMALSGYLATVVAGLRDDLAALAQRAAGVRRQLLAPHGRRREPAGHAPSRARVYLTLDDLLYDKLGERLEAEADPETCAPDVKLVRRLLEEACRGPARHADVVSEYGRAIGGIRSAIQTSVETERARIATVLDGLAR